MFFRRIMSSSVATTTKLSWMRAVRHRWRVSIVGAALITFFLLTTSSWWTSVETDTLTSPPVPVARVYNTDLRRYLIEGLAKERGTWNCRPNTSDCQLTPSLLAVTSAAHPSVVSRTGIDCMALFQGDQRETAAARALMDDRSGQTDTTGVLSDVDLVSLTSDCDKYRQTRGFFSRPLSPEEAEFPIAFSILAYDNMPQVERLLRAIYMPQNVYCLHVDAKASSSVLQAAYAVAKCFDNVFVASHLESVYWGHISIVYAEMSCLQDLMKYHWKYFINLSGFMFPAHSNRELVDILRLYDGANDVEGTINRSDHFWMRVRYWVSWRLSTSLGMNIITFYPKTSAPHNVTIYKGSNQAALTRSFVIYFLYSRQSLDLLNWFADTLAPDEYMWPTLNHNTHLNAPGAYRGDAETKPFTARASIWQPIADQAEWSWSNWPCHGQWVHQICIFGVGDLPWLYRRPELFVNKLYADYEPLTYDCMEELIYNRTVMRAASDAQLEPTYLSRFESPTFDPTYYLRLPFVSNKTSLVVSLDETLRYLQ